MSRKLNRYLHLWLEIIIRVLLIGSFIRLESAEPFIRKILPDEIWMYRYPNVSSYVPTTILWPLVCFVPVVFIILNFLITKDVLDFKSALLAHTLGIGLNGVIVDIIKITVGRPRPDFFWRCFPDGVMNSEMICTGDKYLVMDGRKSFPSGHSSFSFIGMGFLSFYLIGKMKIFTEEGRGRSYRIIFCFCPLVVAMLIAISRTCDYHHHPTDVITGSLIGLIISYFCYRQYFPSFCEESSNFCYEKLKALNQNANKSKEVEKGMMDVEKEIKWI